MKTWMLLLLVAGALAMGRSFAEGGQSTRSRTVPSGDAANLLYLTLEKNKFVVSNLRKNAFSELRLRGGEVPVGKTITNLIAVIVTNKRFIAYSALTNKWHVLFRRPREKIARVDAEDFSAFVVTSDRLLSFAGTSGSWSEQKRE